MGPEVTVNLPILKNTQLPQDSFSFRSVLQMQAVGCQNITELVSRVNKSISFQAKLRQVRLSQFSSPPGKERQAPSSQGSSTLKRSFKKSYLNASSCLLSSQWNQGMMLPSILCAGLFQSLKSMENLLLAFPSLSPLLIISFLPLDFRLKLQPWYHLHAPSPSALNLSP